MQCFRHITGRLQYISKIILNVKFPFSRNTSSFTLRNTTKLIYNKRLWYGPRAAKSAHWLPLTGDCQGSGESIRGIRFQMSPDVSGFHGDIEVIYQQSPRDKTWIHHWSIHFMSNNMSTSNLILRNQMSFQLPNRFGSGQCCVVSKISKRLRNWKMKMRWVQTRYRKIWVWNKFHFGWITLFCNNTLVSNIWYGNGQLPFI